MKVCNLSSWEEFEKAATVLLTTSHKPKHSTLLFRGQSDSCWRLETTLERYEPGSLKVKDYYQTIYRAKHQFETFTQQRWEIPTPSDFEDSLMKSQEYFGQWDVRPYVYMIYLRHHGFPSPLLDWSASPYVAAFFAFNRPTKSSRVSIYAYVEFPSGAKLFSPASVAIHGVAPTVRSHPRHVLQQSEYTICTMKSDDHWFYSCHEDVFEKEDEGQDLLWKFNIPSSERLKVLRLLDRYNLNAFSLFGSEESLAETVALRVLLFDKLVEWTQLTGAQEATIHSLKGNFASDQPSGASDRHRYHDAIER
jgi:hypothetical protein